MHSSVKALRAGHRTPYAAYTGLYQLNTNVEVIIRPEGTRLMAKVSGQDYFEMFPSNRDSFFFKIVDAEVTFTRANEGTVRGLDLHQNRRDLSVRADVYHHSGRFLSPNCDASPVGGSPSWG